MSTPAVLMELEAGLRVHHDGLGEAREGGVGGEEARPRRRAAASSPPTIGVRSQQSARAIRIEAVADAPEETASPPLPT